MRLIALTAAALIGLAACDAPLDPNAPRVALAGADLQERISGRTLTLRPTEAESLITQATVDLRTDGTAAVSAGDEAREMLWTVKGQELCFTRPNQVRDSDDCRTIGWIQGDRFAVFDMTKAPPEKIAEGTIN